MIFFLPIFSLVAFAFAAAFEAAADVRTMSQFAAGAFLNVCVSLHSLKA